MVGEILGLQYPRMAKIQSNQATMNGQHFGILSLYNDKIQSNQSTMVGEILGLQNTRMAKIQSNQATMIGQHFRILGLHNDKIHNQISPPWLEKF